MQDPNKLLKTAVDDIIHQINDNKLPAHDAVVKTAKSMDLNVHFIKRACEVINVALTYEHFRKHAADRDSDFPIVDAQKVSAEIFPDTAPTVAEKKSQLFANTFVEEEVPNFRKAKNNESFKAAYVHLMSQKEEARGMSAQGICEKAGQAKQNMLQDLDNARTELVGAKLAVNRNFANLVGYWSKEAAARQSFADFESQVYSRFGEAAVPYLDFIHKSANCSEPRGEHDPKHVAFDDSKELGMFADFYKSASEIGDALNKVAQHTSDIVQMENLKNASYRHLGEQRLAELREQDEEVAKIAEEVVAKIASTEEAEEDPVLVAALKKSAAIKEASVEKTAGLPFSGVMGWLGGVAKNQLSPAAPPGSGSNLHNLDRKLLIQNLMSTDPILKTYEPKKVVDAYEQFLRIAPELSNEKEIVRSHLREAVASQAVSAFVGSQLVDANTKLLKQRHLESGIGVNPSGARDNKQD